MKKSIYRKTTAYTSGILILTLGVGLTVKADLGVSPTTSIPYTLTLITGIDMGKTTIIFHIILVFSQIIILGKHFKIKNLLQIPVAVVFGYFTTMSNNLISMIPFGNSIPERIILSVSGTFLIALGVSIYLPADIMPVAVEGTIQTISDKLNAEFSSVKIIFDISLVIISLSVCLIILKSSGSIGVGTVIAAFLTGAFIKLIKIISGKFHIVKGEKINDTNRSWL